MKLFISPHIERLIDLALEEDQVSFDVTSQAFFADGIRRRARLVARQDLVFSGGAVARAVFRRVDEEIRWQANLGDGQSAASGDVLATVEGPADSLLSAERTALNFLQRMSGVATTTRAHVQAIKSATTKVVDTRKTLPGWRVLDKYAVRCGGGYNHRYALGGGVMIKENHIMAAGGIEEAVSRVRGLAPHTLAVEVEVEHIDQVDEALSAGAEVIMLDNMHDEEMVEAISRIRAHRRGSEVIVEASGNMDLDRLAGLGDLGLDVVSVGALTHSATAADISMLLDPEK